MFDNDTTYALNFNIVNWGTGDGTLPWKQWCCNLCWKGRDRAQSFVLMFTGTTVEYLNRNVSIGQLLYTFKIYCGVCTVKAKNADKNI